MRELVGIKLGRTEYFMRPDHQAYGEIEERLGALRTVYSQVIVASAPLETLAQIVYVGMKSSGSLVDEKSGGTITVEGISERLFDAGPWSEEVISPIVDYLGALGWTPAQRKKIAEQIAAEAEQRPPL